MVPIGIILDRSTDQPRSIPMRAVAYRHSLPVTDPQALEDVELPRPEASGRDLLVEIRAVSVNPVDTKVRHRVDPAGEPKVLGYDAAGIVVAAGPDATRFKPGDTVGVGCMVGSCQHCAACEEGLEQYCENGMVGTYHKCDAQHLQRYVTEFEFRFNNRIGLGINDKMRADALLKGIEGKRLTYRRPD